MVMLVTGQVCFQALRRISEYLTVPALLCQVFAPSEEDDEDEDEEEARLAVERGIRDAARYERNHAGMDP
jgi:hypothetical protein